jgi:hypothetical protein
MNVILLHTNQRNVSAGHLQGGDNKKTVTINVSELSERLINTDTLIVVAFPSLPTW